MTLGIIAALNDDRVIGAGGTLPWHYPADLKRFKRVTLGCPVIMGRRTWESLPRRPLPGRLNVVISTHPERIETHADVRCYATVPEAVAALPEGDAWFIGGARVFEEALSLADLIDLTWVPNVVRGSDVVRFPELDEAVWLAGPRERDPDDARLEHQIFRRRLHAG